MASDSPSRELLDRIEKLSPKRLALLAAELERRLAALEEPAAQPIAITGLACRLPGGIDTPEAFWDLLASGGDAIEVVPSSRWDAEALYDPLPGTPGKANTKWGGFVTGIDQFDPTFFGIAPREAVGMDPQQRMLLEVAWEALENAGERGDLLNGSQTGVFVGISTHDYVSLMSEQDKQTLGAYSGTGLARSVAAGRLSYFLGLRGPNLSVDTACSSSSVAIHLACQSLRQRECRLALAGGANAILAPQLTVTLSQAHMLAGDGRCKTFAQSADGFVRSEGCGMLVLKRLADAQADGDRILGIIRGSAINHDGRSNGLTAPNGPSQEAVIRAALKQALLSPEDVDYIEAHGTGTVLGDAIELGSLGACFGSRPQTQTPLTIGSVKTNVGHLEAAAGVTSVIKVLLSFEHQSIPPHVHVSEGSENEALRNLPLKLPLHIAPWPASSRARIAGVSSFGFSGTNSHIVLEEAPASEALRDHADDAEIVTVSAKSAAALSAQCARHAGYLRRHPQTRLSDFAFTLNTGRSHFQHRIAFLANSASEAADRLEQIAGQDIESDPAYRFIAGYEEPSIGFLFTGQGSQYAGMARGLYESQAIFRAAVDECDSILSGKLEHKLSSILCGEATVPSGLIDETQITQPALFAFEYALAMLWSSWGVRPSVVAGHSLGEYAAACIAGVFPLDAALTLAYERGRLMATLPRSGAMLAVRAGEAEVSALLPQFPGLGLAAVNGDRSVVVSGSSAQTELLRAQLTGQGIASQPLVVSHAFHSSLMDPILDEFEREAAKLVYHPPELPLISNLNGQLHSTAEQIDGSYWRRHIRDTVRFAEGLSSLVALHPVALLEIGPDPVLLGMARPALTHFPISSIPSLRRSKEARHSLNDALRQLYLLGAPIAWHRVYEDRPGRKLALPTYPFQRQRYWIETRQETASTAGLPAPTRESSYDSLLYTTEWRVQQGSASAFQPPTPEELLGAATKAALEEDGLAGTLKQRQTILAAQHGAESLHGKIHTSLLFSGSAEPDLISSALYPVFEAAGIAFEKLETGVTPGAQTGIALERALQQKLCREIKPSSIVFELPEAPANSNVPDLTLENALNVLALIRAILETGTNQGAYQGTIWLVTRGSAAIENDQSINLPSAISHAMMSSVRLECPELSVRWVDLPLNPAKEDWIRFGQLIRTDTRETSMAIRQGKLVLSRLVSLNEVASRDTRPFTLVPGAAYLVTGAYSGLGLRTVQWMADRGARRIFMAGRREPSTEIGEQISKLRDRGVEIHVVVSDISKRRDVETIFKRISESGFELRGIVNSALSLDDGTLLQLTREKFATVFASKVTGSWLLHEFSRSCPLDFFVLYGSAASILGSAGQSNYAAANGFQDALSRQRQREGLPSVTIAWGPWSEIGAASRLNVRWRAARLGMGSFTPDKGIELLEQAISSGLAEVAALPVDWRAALPQMRAHGVSAFFEDLPELTHEDIPSAADPLPLNSLLETTPAENRLCVIEEYLRSRILHVLGLESGFALRDDQPLAELGLDSLMALDLKNGLQKDSGVTLNANFFFEYPTLELAAMYMNARLAGASDGTGAQANSSDYEEIAL